MPVGVGQRKHQAKEPENGNPPDHAPLYHERPLSGTVCSLNTAIGPYYATRKPTYAADDAANCTWMHILNSFLLAERQAQGTDRAQRIEGASGAICS